MREKNIRTQKNFVSLTSKRQYNQTYVLHVQNPLYTISEEMADTNEKFENRVKVSKKKKEEIIRPSLVISDEDRMRFAKLALLNYHENWMQMTPAERSYQYLAIYNNKRIKLDILRTMTDSQIRLYCQSDMDVETVKKMTKEEVMKHITRE